MSIEPTPTSPRERITLERTLRAPVEKVWRLWTTKAGLETGGAPRGSCPW